jgi:hypothetical protein
MHRTLRVIAGAVLAVALVLGFGSVPAGVASAAIPVAQSCEVGEQIPLPNRPQYNLDMVVDPSARAQIEAHLEMSFQPDKPITEVVVRLWPNGRNDGSPQMRFSNVLIQRDAEPATQVQPRLENLTTMSIPLVAKAGAWITAF